MTFKALNKSENALLEEDYPVHDWYRFVLSYPPHLVRTYLERFGIQPHQRVLDPFCGTGTTLVECKKLGIESFGIEANTITHFASSVKLDWSIDPQELIEHSLSIAQRVRNELSAQDINDDGNLIPLPNNLVLRELPEDAQKVMLRDSISDLPLHKTLTLLNFLNQEDILPSLKYERLAVAKALITTISNLKFAPEVSIGVIKEDTPVVTPWLQIIRSMAHDLTSVAPLRHIPSHVYHADARQISEILEPESIDFVMTSPPYPNEKDYTRITRIESVLLGFIENKNDLRALKKNLIRSNTRNVYVGDDDDIWVRDHEIIQQTAEAIENRRIELGKDSGFEKLYGKVTKLYFGGMMRHLADLRKILRPGAYLAYVVGDQASYLQVMIRTGQILASIAETLGYEVVGIDLFRTRAATATRSQLREEILILRWLG